MRRGCRLVITAHRWGCAEPRPGFPLGHLPFAFDDLRRFSRFPVGHPAAGNRLPRDLSGASPMAAEIFVGTGAFCDRALALPLAAVPVNVHVRRSQTVERRRLVVEADRVDGSL